MTSVEPQPDPAPAPVPVPLADLGWDDAYAAHYAALAGPDTSVGRIVRVDRGRLHVLTAAGPVVVAVSAGGGAVPAADPGEAACTGDWVVVRAPGDGRAEVTALLPRRSALRRASPGGDSRGQALAANADTAALVEGLVPAPDLTRMERLLVLLWETGAVPLVVLTKADLVPDPVAAAAAVAEIAPGVEVLVVSSLTGAGYDALRPHVAPGRTLALLGRSGAGKSSLSNRLVGSVALATREIRADGKGRHTTVRRELLPVPGGGAVIDTPGLRGAGLWAVDDGVATVFADVADLAERCRFADCAHVGEPDCAVAAALADGSLSERRWASFRKLAREAEWIASRTDARLRSERAKAWKRVHLDLRRQGGGRPQR